MSDPARLPPAELATLAVGYMRLSDAAPLILAKEEGLFTHYGLDVQLRREVSWANLRDKLVVGELDAAQLLAPLPLMTSFGAAGLRSNLLTGLSLGLNGNAITFSNALWDSLGLRFPGKAPDALQVAQALARTLQQRRSGAPLSFATVHAFSMHTFLLRQWLRAGGVDPDADIRLIVLPPEQMCESLARGIIDGFCVGEPWSTVAVEQGIGTVACSGYQIWNNAPEKVLGVTEQWHNTHPATHLRLRLAIMEACQRLTSMEQRVHVAELMSRREYLNLPVRMLLPSLTGQYRFSKHDESVAMPEFHVFWKYHAGFPWRSQAQWILTQCSAMLGRPISEEEGHALVQQAWRPSLYREAARHLGALSPSHDGKEENLHDAPWEFEPGIVLGADRWLG
jgi:ABC-type nitrate/sulfonate/bicarbonate transport system substrate-binding protein